MTRLFFLFILIASWLCSHPASLEADDRKEIQKYALNLLQEGIYARDPEVQLLSAYGAGIATHEDAYQLLEKSLESPYPQIQLAALSFLSARRNEQSLFACQKCLSSPFLALRIEACYHLALMRRDNASSQIDSLMMKTEEPFHKIFPELFAILGDDFSTNRLKQLLNHKDMDVRIAAVLAAAKYKRDDLLPIIRILGNQFLIHQQEACAFAFGELSDQLSIDRLQQLANSKEAGTVLASLIALEKLGVPNAKESLEEAAIQGSLFACKALGSIKNTENTLYKLVKSTDRNLRANASLALLEKGDPTCLPTLLEFITTTESDLALIPIYTPSKALCAWKVLPSAKVQLSKNPTAYEQTIRIKEELILKAMLLSEQSFLTFANALLEKDTQALIPTLTNSLERLQSEQAIEVLQKGQQKVGSPLTRISCTLALYRMQEDPKMTEQLFQWVEKTAQDEELNFRPLLPWLEKKDAQTTEYTLTPQEKSRLLIESFQAIAATQEDRGIHLLYEQIKKSKNKNRYALAGLLVLATQ